MMTKELVDKQQKALVVAAIPLELGDGGVFLMYGCVKGTNFPKFSGVEGVVFNVVTMFPHISQEMLKSWRMRCLTHFFPMFLHTSQE